MRTTIMRYALCATLFLVLASAGQVLAENTPFDWQSNDVGAPYVTPPNTRSVVPGGTYAPTIYAVGSEELPSAAYDPTGEKTRANKPGVKTGHGDDNISGPEYGQTQYSPIGDAWVLIAFAACFALWQLTRRKRALND